MNPVLNFGGCQQKFIGTTKQEHARLLTNHQHHARTAKTPLTIEEKVDFLSIDPRTLMTLMEEVVAHDSFPATEVVIGQFPISTQFGILFLNCQRNA